MNMLTGGVNAANIASAPDTSQPALLDASGIAVYRVILAIRAMLERCETEDRNTQAMLAIIALIEAGIDTGPRIVGSAKALGFDPAHFGAFLRRSTGSIRGRHLWKRKSNGVYEVLGPASEPQLVTVPVLLS